MENIFTKAFSDVCAEDVTNLIKIRYRENQSLDYKREFWSENKEMLKDISSFANAYGGFIIIGVGEDEDHYPEYLYNIEKAEDRAESIEQSCVASITPRISGLKCRVLGHSSGEKTIIVFIPSSIRKPHMVTLSKMNKFWIRYDLGTASMSIDEIRDACINNVTIWKTVETFIKERESTNVDESSGKPFLVMGACPIQTNEDIIDIKNPIVQRFLREPPGLTEDEFLSFKRLQLFHEPTLTGLKICAPDQMAIELFCNGYYEVKVALDVVQRGAFDGILIINNQVITGFVVDFFRSLAALVGLLGIEYSYVGYLSFHNIAELRFSKFNSVARITSTVLWPKPDLKLPPRRINNLSHPDKEAKGFLDKLWNAFGEEENPFFKDGSYIKSRQQ